MKASIFRLTLSYLVLTICVQSHAQIQIDSTYVITDLQDAYPSWSPDGTMITFESNRNGRYTDIFVMNADGSNVRQLTNHEYAAETPVWSPDGQFILYTVYQDSLYKNNEIHLMRADGSELQKLTDHPLRDGHAKFSPDGQKIVFNSQRDDDGTFELGNYEVYEMSIDGSGVKRLTEHEDWDTYPSYSPDGKKVLWRRILADTTAPRGYNSEIFLLNLSDGEIKNLSNNPYFDGYPEWSPDGTKIIFASSRNGENTSHLQLFIMNADGSGVQQLTWNKVGEEDNRPDWSPDGKKIMFNRENEDGTRIYIMDISATERKVQLHPMDYSVIKEGRASSRGVAWGDYNGDGYADLMVANTMNNSEFLYENNSSGNLRLITEGEAVTAAGWTEGINWIDYDNDGDLDLFLTTQFGNPNELFQNDGKGVLKKVQAGRLTSDSTSSPSACWCDYDLDGDLDVYVIQRDGADDILYQNEGDGTFQAVSRNLFPYSGGDGRACAWGDTNGDGHPDLYVGNFLDKTKEEAAKSHNFYYRNNGNGSFSNVNRSVLTSGLNLTYGVSFVDYDQDEDLDLFITNVARSDQNFLFQNDGKGNFQKLDNAISNAPNRPSKGHTWGDFDNDGDLDLFVVNGTEGTTQEEIMNFMFLSDWEGDFRLTEQSIIAQRPNISAGTAWSDFDRDGDLDLFIANWGGNTEANDFYRNDLYGTNWIGFSLRGTKSNTMGIGAKVKVKTRIDGREKWLVRWLLPQTGYGSQNEPIAHFGLGKMAEVTEVIVEWPSGTITKHKPPGINRYFNISESGEMN